MDIATVMWIVSGVLFFFCIVMFVLIIAGRDILLAMLRYFNKKGVDVFIASSSRNISQHYKTPKDNKIKVDGLTYICNPEKIQNLSEVDKLNVMSNLVKRDQRLTERIEYFRKKVLNIQAMAKNQPDDVKNQLRAEEERFNNIIISLENKKRLQQQNYFKDRRPAFFYIEGDPIPKDFHEWYSGLDSKILDNLTAAALTIPPANALQAELKFLKLLIIVAAGAAAVAALLSFRSAGNIKIICDALKVVCK